MPCGDSLHALDCGGGGVTGSIATIALLVRDYNEAIAWFTQVLGFSLVEDTPQPDGKRWVVVQPQAAHGASLLLARAISPRQRAQVGDQAGGRIFLFLQTDDFWGDYALLRSRGVFFEGDPRIEPYGTVVVFHDVYGNRWDLLESKRLPDAAAGLQH